MIKRHPKTYSCVITNFVMREFGFTMEYDEGADPVMDVFIRNPEMYNEADSISVSTAGLWRVDSFTGPEPALQELEEVYTSNLVCNDCLGVHQECDAVWRYQVIQEETGYRSIYSYLKQINYCHSVPFLSLTNHGNGLFFDAQRNQDTYHWRVLLPTSARAGDLYDDIEEGLPPGISVGMTQLKQPESWGETDSGFGDLPHEQLDSLVTAVEMGYYETPREVTLNEIAERLGVPESTCRYRLRRAESWLTKNFIRRNNALSTSRMDTPDTQ